MQLFPNYCLFLFLCCSTASASNIFSSLYSLLPKNSAKPAQLSILHGVERTLLNQFQAKMASMKSLEHLMKADSKPVQFPEASAMREFVIDKAAGYANQWIENNPHFLDPQCTAISKHVLLCRPVDCASEVISGQERERTLSADRSIIPPTSRVEAFTTFLVFRPSFAAQLNTEVSFPVDVYIQEANEVSPVVIEAMKATPQDQFIFVGLHGASAVALFTAWRALIEVEQVFFNHVAYGGELHQMKLFLFESDCILSALNAQNFPLPAWDILRFYTPNYAAQKCQFRDMAPVGLTYQAPSSLMQSVASFFFARDLGTSARDIVELRSKFLAYDETMAAAATQRTKHSGSSDDRDEVMSQVSMASARSHRPELTATAASKESETSISNRIILGMKCLKDSLQVASQFKTMVSLIYRSNRRSYLQRDVDNCAHQLTETLKTNLIDQGPDFIIPKGIKSIKCSVTEYSILTRLAQVTCLLTGRDDSKSKSIRFEVTVERAERPDISRFDFKITSVSDELERVASSLSTGSEFDSSSAADDERSRFTSVHFNSASVNDSKSFETCLGALFSGSKDYLYYLNPIEASSPTQAALSAARSVAASVAAPLVNGHLSLPTKLPYSQINCACKFNLKTGPVDYLGMYRHSPFLFFDLFSASMNEFVLPEQCEKVIEPPKIEVSDRGNAELFIKRLTELFSRNTLPSLSNPQDITATLGSFQGSDPYVVFTAPVLKERIFSCLAKSPQDYLYDCNAAVTRWAGHAVCPDYCRVGGIGAHLCSRVLVCGDGLFLGFRGASAIENTLGSAGAVKEGSLQKYLTPANGPSVFAPLVSSGKLAAFTMKSRGPGGLVDSTIHFAVFLNEGTFERIQTGSGESFEERLDDFGGGQAFQTAEFGFRGFRSQQLQQQQDSHEYEVLGGVEEVYKQLQRSTFEEDVLEDEAARDLKEVAEGEVVEQMAGQTGCLGGQNADVLVAESNSETPVAVPEADSHAQAQAHAQPPATFNAGSAATGASKTAGKKKKGK